MRVTELMKTDLASVRVDPSISDAIMALVDAHVLAFWSPWPRKAAGVPPNPGWKTQVRDLMTVRPRIVAPEDEVRKAAQEMLYLGIHRVFVVSDEQLVGVLSQSDVVQAFANGVL